MGLSSYGKLLKHKLLYLGLDSNTIIKNMRNYTITLEEAIRSEVYRVNCKEKKYKWLEELYEYLIDEVSSDKEEAQTLEDITSMFYLIVNEYKLNKDEYNFLWNMFSKYINTMKKYQIVDVGLDDNKGSKLNKIIMYNFDEKMICDALFITYEFDGNVLRARDSSFYKRMMLLKELIMEWNRGNDFVHDELINKYSLTPDEVKFITSKRREVSEYVSKYNQVINGRKH